VQLGNGAERVVLLDVIFGLVLCAQFQTNAVDAFDPNTFAMNDGWLLGRRGLRFKKRESLASAALGGRCGRSSMPAKICTVGVSVLGQIIGQ